MIRRKPKKQSSNIPSTAIVKFGTDSKILQSELYQGKPKRYNKKTLNLVNHMSRKMTKVAGCNTGTNTMQSGPMFYHPEYEPSSLLMPRDPIEVNAWARYFYKYDALVSTAIDAHAELPISTIRLTMPDGKDRKKNVMIKDEYEDMCSTENLDLFNKLLQIGVEYYKLGNVFPFAQWSDRTSKWSKLTILDPDYVEVDKLQFSDKMRVDLRPNDRLKEIVSNGPNHAKTGLLYQAIPEDVRELIATGMKIPLNTNPKLGSHVSHISYKMADYDTIGTGLIERNFKPLVYKDRLRQSQDAIAARHLTPKHLIWAENAGTVDVEAIREQVDNAFADPDYAIITNFELHWELIGTNQGLMSLDSEWNWITEELMIGLMINRSFLLGEGTFANGQTALEVMNQRYSIYRERLESYIIHSLFLPMAMRNDWAEFEPGTVKKEKKIKWLYPKIRWNRLNFVDDTAHKQMLSQMVNQGQIDLQTWLEQFGLDAETIQDRLRRWEGTPLDVNYFSENQSIASEVGRVLAPAIAKLRAEQRGIELPEQEEDGNMMFSNKKGIEKKAETRDQREHERTLQKVKHKVDNNVKKLEVPLEKRKKPPRKDMQKPKLFEGASENYDELALLNPDKSEDIINDVRNRENKEEKWQEYLISSGLDQNSRRVIKSMEDAFSGLNGNNNSKTRIELGKKYLPQLFARKIQGSKSLMEKTELAKVRFVDDILDYSVSMDMKLSKCKTKQEMKEAVQSVVKEMVWKG